MDLSIQDKLKMFMETNKISLYDMKHFLDFQYDGFLQDLFLRRYGYIKVEQQTKDYEVYRFFQDDALAFKRLEDCIGKNKFVHVYERFDNENPYRKFFCNGSKTIEHFFDYIDSYKDGSFIPIFLIVDGKTDYNVKYEFVHNIKQIGK